MTIPANAFFVADRLKQCLAERDADILNGMMVVNVQVALCLYIQINQTVTGDLIQHVIEKRNAGCKILATGTVQIDCDMNLRFVGIADNFCGSGR